MKKVYLSAVMVLAMASTASALTLFPSDTSIFGTENNVPDIYQELIDDFGITLGDFLYKAEVPAGEEGPFASSYMTSFFNTSDDPSDALIEYTGGSSITDPEYLLVKDGNMNPAWYLFDISSWNGTEDIELLNFWPDRGAISHVAIYGDGGSPVPEPATMLLFGAGLVGLAGIRRKGKK